MFADRATIIIKSGKGGDGHVSFRREKYVPDGGPDGGDGGRGGDIVFVVDDGLNTLTDYRHRRKFAAQPGEEGGKRNCHGKNGEDLILKVPAGTVIKDAESGKVIADMSGDNRRQVILKGGRGGLGNQHFATSTMQAPKYAQPGGDAIELEVKSGIKGDRGRRSGRFSECWKVNVIVKGNQCTAKDRQLPFYNLTAKPWCRRLRWCEGICHCRHSGTH